MNKKLIFITITTILFLTGCSKNNSSKIVQQNKQSPLAASTTKSADVKSPTDAKSIADITPTAAVSTAAIITPEKTGKTVSFTEKTISTKTKNSHGITIKFDLIMPILTGNYSGIETINNYYNAKEKEYTDEKDSDYFSCDGNNNPDLCYYLSAKYHQEAQIGDIISIVGDCDSCAGGVSNPEIVGDVFNLNSGKKLGLDDIFKVNKEQYLKIIIDKVSQKIDENIQNRNPDEESGYNFDTPYSDEGKKIISQYDVNDFYLRKNSLVVFYPKYALCCGAGEPQKFDIPFESISQVLNIDVSNGQ